MTDFGSRHKISHQDGGGDEIDATGLVGRVNFVDRGDPAVTDWSITTLTADGSWHDLDCSSIVPAGTKGIMLRVVVSATASGKIMHIRKNGNINFTNALAGITQVANVSASHNGIVPCDGNRTLEYLISPGTWGTLGITILGWFI